MSVSIAYMDMIHLYRNCLVLIQIIKFSQKGFPPAPTPNVSKSEQTSQTLTGLLRLYFMMGISLAEHLEHNRRPQCLQWCFLVVRPNLF